MYDGSGNPIGATLFTYDGTTPTTSSGVPQHVAVTGARGNLTSWVTYASSGTGYPYSATYEDTGTVLTSTTPNGTTTYGYDSTFVYNQSVTPPTPPSGVSLEAGAGYDTSYTGLPTGTTDANGQESKVTSYDEMLRPTEAQYPDGGETALSYTPTTLTTNVYQTASTYSTSEIQYDTYGRSSRSILTNGQSTNPYYQQDQCYDGNGNVSFVSYTYQSTGLTASKVCSGAGDTYSYDALGRVTKVLHSDGTSHSYTYTGRDVESVDENSVTLVSQVDGLGRTTIVCEISSSTTMPSSGSPAGCGASDITQTGFATDYSYTLSTGTTTVTQGQQTRVFQVDWLGRPTSITEPEHISSSSSSPGPTTYSYTYNATGLQVVRTKPTANQSSESTVTTTTTQYDNQGRVQSVTYSDGTPTKNYSYDLEPASGWGDLNATNVKGRLAAERQPGRRSRRGRHSTNNLQLHDSRAVGLKLHLFVFRLRLCRQPHELHRFGHGHMELRLR